MKTLKQYNIKKDLITPQTCYITRGAEIVSLLDLGFDLALVALCDITETNLDLRTFKICSSFESIYEDNIRYIGNFGEQHVIEIL